MMTTTNHITKIIMGTNTPSFMRSTLSICFILCVIASIIFVAIGVDTSNPAFDIVKVVVGAYVGSRIPSLPDNQQKDDGAKEE